MPGFFSAFLDASPHLALNTKVLKAKNNPRMPVGVVEEPGVEEKKAFHSLYQLWDILNQVKKAETYARRNKNSKHDRNAKHCRSQKFSFTLGGKEEGRG